MDLVEKLKNVPTGTKLHSPLFKDPITFVRINTHCRFQIICRTSASETIEFDNKGYFTVETASQNCMLFPTPEMTWENYRYIKDKQLIAVSINGKYAYIGCAKGGFYTTSIICYWRINLTTGFVENNTGMPFNEIISDKDIPLINELINDRGYIIGDNGLIKTFKKGDIVVSAGSCVAIVDHIGEFGSFNDVVYYQCCLDYHGELTVKTEVGIGRACGCKYASTQDQERILKKLHEHRYILDGDTVVKKRFDPKTFEPYQKVLVRSTPSAHWRCTFFSHMINGMAVCSSDNWPYCIPYKLNEHLRGKTDDCKDFYKWWENN